MASQSETRAGTNIPSHLPEMNSFLTITNYVRTNGFEDELPQVPESLVNSVRQLLTPDELFNVKKLPVPEVITLSDFPTFDALAFTKRTNTYFTAIT